MPSTIDGQSIATRLAKKISSATSTLKRAVSKYNSMPPDSMEGNMYHLPRELNWENISNFEQLTSLEVSTLVCNTTFIPIDTQIKVMRALNMKQRAIEEQKMIKNEMATVVYSYKHEHSLLKKYIQDSVQSQATLTQFQRGCLSLLYNRLLFCESFLINLSNAFSVYHDVVLPEFILLGPNGMLCTSVTTLNHQTCESLVDVQCCNSDTESDSDSQSDVDHDSL